MDRHMLQAFADELRKIAGVPKSLLQANGKGASKHARHYISTRPNAHAFGQRWARVPEAKRGEARAFGESAKNESRAALGVEKKKYPWMEEKAASARVEANKLFGLPVHVAKRGRRRYENAPSEAQTGNAGLSPAAGQSTANIAQSSAMVPQTGPGGV